MKTAFVSEIRPCKKAGIDTYSTSSIRTYESGRLSLLGLHGHATSRLAAEKNKEEIARLTYTPYEYLVVVVQQ